MHENGTGQQTTKTLTQKDKIGGKNIDQKTNEEGRKWRRLAQTQDDNRKNLKFLGEPQPTSQLLQSN